MEGRGKRPGSEERRRGKEEAEGTSKEIQAHTHTHTHSQNENERRQKVRAKSGKGSELPKTLLSSRGIVMVRIWGGQWQFPTTGMGKDGVVALWPPAPSGDQPSSPREGHRRQ